MYRKTISLKNGVVIPMLGLGTWLIDDDKVEDVVKDALDVGYRHFDTAQAYANERGVGKAVRESGIDRRDIFVTTKLAAEIKDYEGTRKAIDESLRTMGLDYIDLMIIHSPQPWNEVNQSTDRYFKGNLEAWRALEEAYSDGKLKAIGVSNFMHEDLDNLLENARIRPMVNQILCHIANTPFDLIEYCRNKDIVLEAYSPIAHGEVLNNDAIRKMAEKYHVSTAQLCIRYDLEMNMITLPKSSSKEHMIANADVDFVIDEKDMEVLKKIDKIKDYGESSIFPVFGGKI